MNFCNCPNLIGLSTILYTSLLKNEIDLSAFIPLQQVQDLLNPSRARDSLPVRWSRDRGFYVENLFFVECDTLDDLTAVLEEGMATPP